MHDSDAQDTDVVTYLQHADQLAGTTGSHIAEFNEKLRGDKDQAWVKPSPMPPGASEMRMREM